jgi:putative NADH-flavin reductase
MWRVSPFRLQPELAELLKVKSGRHGQTGNKESMQQPSTFLVFGATGGTGKHFISLALEEGHSIRALVRNPAKLAVQNPNLHVQQGSITDVTNLDELVQGVDFVVSMLGDVNLQRDAKINTAFVKKLIPAMRRHGVKRFLYQAGGLSKPYQGHLSPVLWMIKHTLARGFAGQHADNEAVMEYLVEEAKDMEWMVHRAGIGSDGPSKGILKRSENKFSIATFRDCAAYNLRTVPDASAIHTCDLSCYARG